MQNDLARLIERANINPLYRQYNAQQVEELYHQYYQPKWPYLEVLEYDEYGNPLMVIPNPYPWLEPCFECQGFWYVPGTNNEYACNEYGNVYSVYNDRLLEQPVNSRGYRNIRFQQLNPPLFLSVHRLVSAMFIPEICPFKQLQVNHINNVSNDNHVSNLEWCTQSENLQHYYQNYNERAWLKIEVKNIHTGEITLYTNRIQAATAFNKSKDWIEYILSQPDTRVWEGGYQIRVYNPNNQPFPILSEAELRYELSRTGPANAVEVRNIFTNEVLRFDQQSHVCEYFNISPAMVSVWSNSNQELRVLNNQVYQIKAAHIPEWRQVIDPYLELGQSGLYCPVKVIYPDGRFEIYYNVADCANANGMKKTALNMRLNYADPTKFWRDGKAYIRYRDLPGF